MIDCIGVMTCDIIFNKTDEPFITSDSPVCVLKKVDGHYTQIRFKRGESNIIIFPYSKDICFKFYISPLIGNDWFVKECKDIENIKVINTLIYKCCKDQVYTSQNKLNLTDNIQFSIVKYDINIEDIVNKINE